MWEESKIAIEELDVDCMCKYLGKHLKRGEITEEGFEELLYKKRPKQKKATKKVGRKKIKYSKVKKSRKEKVKDSCQGGDTPATAPKEDIENKNTVDKDTLERDDTLEIVEKMDKKMKKTQ